MRKESYAHISRDGRISTVSFWENEDALKAWTPNPINKEGMEAGKGYIFSRYAIRIYSQLRHYEFTLKN